MIDILNQILNFFITLGDYLIQFFKNLFLLISQVPKYLGVLLDFSQFMPAWLVLPLIIIVLGGVILYFLGR